MNILLILIPFALIIACIFLALFLWAAKDGQFDDLTSPSQKMLLDENNNINEKEKL